MKMSKKILIILIFASVLMGSFCFAQRKLEIIYPTAPGAETPTTVKTALPEYLKYVFTFAIMIAGLLAFGALIYGGFSYLTSAGEPSKMKDGQDQIIAGILGLIIVLSSFLILNTINPQLVLPGGALQPGEAGIRIYTVGSCCEAADIENKSLCEDENSFKVTTGVPDLTDPDLNLEKFQEIASIKFLGEPGELTAVLWAEPDFKGNGTTVDYPAGDTQPCESVTPSTYKSISLDWHTPGVYLYSNSNDCGKNPTTGNLKDVEVKIYQASSATLPEFDNKTQSIKFIYGDKNLETGEYGAKYSAILHEKENFMGQAALFDQGQNICLNLSAAEGGQTSNILDNPGKYYSSNPIGISSCEAAPGCDTNCDECESQVECDASSASCHWIGSLGCLSFPADCDANCSKCSTPQYCEWSKAYCYWDDSGFWATCVSFAECDQDCSKCGIEEACENSSAVCQWDWFHEECKSVAGCDTDCSKCGTQSACRDSPAYCYWNGSTCEVMPPDCDVDCSKCTTDGTCSFSKANCEWNLFLSKCTESSGPGCDTHCPGCTHKIDCEASPAGCYWYASQCLAFPSGCDTDCSKCTDYSSCEVSKAVCLWILSKSECESMPAECDNDCPKCNFREECEKSSANCIWTWENKCKLITGCDTNCSNCTNESTCEASPASCSWDSLKDECKATVPSSPPAPDGHGYGTNLSGAVSSITVYLKPMIKDGQPQIVGQGVIFYENKNYTMYDDSDKCKAKTPPPIYGEGQIVSNVDTLKYCTDNCDAGCNDRISSMEMDGHYIALLCRDPNLRDDCEVFSSSCADFRNHRIGQCGPWGRKDCLSSFIIKARK